MTPNGRHQTQYCCWAQPNMPRPGEGGWSVHIYTTTRQRAEGRPKLADNCRGETGSAANACNTRSELSTGVLQNQGNCAASQAIAGCLLVGLPRSSSSSDASCFPPGPALLCPRGRLSGNGGRSRLTNSKQWDTNQVFEQKRIALKHGIDFWRCICLP